MVSVNGPHGNNNVFGIFCPIVHKRMIFAPGKLRYFLHVVLNNVRNCIVKAIGCLTTLEVNIGILGSSSGYRMFRIERAIAEFL
jgi:hypothetical protein